METYRIGSWWFGSSGLACNDDLIDRQDRPRRFSSKLDGPALRDHQVEDTLVFGVESSGTVLVLCFALVKLHVCKGF